MKKKKKNLICCYLLILQPLSFKQFMLVGTGNPGKFGHKRLAEIHRGADSHCSKPISALLPNKVKPPHPTDLTQKQPRLTDRNWLPSPVQKALPSLPACWGARGSVWNREGYQSGPYFLFLVAQMWRCFAAEELAVGGGRRITSIKSPFHAAVTLRLRVILVGSGWLAVCCGCCTIWP